MDCIWGLFTGPLSDGRRGGFDPQAQTEVEAAGGLLLPEDTGCLKGGHAVEKGPEGDGSLRGEVLAVEAADLRLHEAPELDVGWLGAGLWGGGQEGEGEDVGLLAGEAYIGARDASEGLLGRFFPRGFLERPEEAALTLFGEGGFERGAVCEVAVEGIWSNSQSRGHASQGKAVETIARDLIHGGGEDGLSICLGGVRHMRSLYLLRPG